MTNLFCLLCGIALICFYDTAYTAEDQFEGIKCHGSHWEVHNIWARMFCGANIGCVIMNLVIIYQVWVKHAPKT